VRAALDNLGNALVSGRADAVLAAEAPLADAVGALTAADRASIGPDDRARLRADMLETRLALSRCIHLGDAATQLVRSAFPDVVYGRSGQSSGRPGAGASRTGD
jgi:hypothetical protein